MASVPRDNVLRLKRTDHKTKRVLLNVHRKAERSDTLDLKLTGTDFDFVYVGETAQSSLKSLQASTFTGKPDEWRTVLEFILLQRRSQGLRPDVLDGVEVVASIAKETLTITIRKNISGITQKLGAIQLLEDTDNTEIATLDWVECAVANSDDLRAQLETAEQQADDQQAQVASLTAELDKLISAKKKHEDEMLSKFAALLNAKKSKIRDQQRLLAGAWIESIPAEKADPAIPSATNSSRRADTSRKGKRKANGIMEPESEELEDDDDARTINGTGDEDDDRLRQETPEITDEDPVISQSDLEGNTSVIANAVAKSQTTRRITSQRSQRLQRSSREIAVGSQESPSTSRRKLPSRTAKSPSKEPTPPLETNEANDEHDDETEDEL